MKFYVMGFVFNKAKDRVLLIRKNKPEWQAGHWNGVGGKINVIGIAPDFDKSPLVAIRREVKEETGVVGYDWKHCITFTCPGGTVFVFSAISDYEEIMYEQLETEQLDVSPVDALPNLIMPELKWIIPVCLSSIQFPLIVQQNTLGVDG